MYPQFLKINMSKSKAKHMNMIPIRKSWATAQDDEGRVYYYNRTTNEATWEKPRALILAEEAAIAKVADRINTPPEPLCGSCCVEKECCIPSPCCIRADALIIFFLSSVSLIASIITLYAGRDTISPLAINIIHVFPAIVMLVHFGVASRTGGTCLELCGLSVLFILYCILVAMLGLDGPFYAQIRVMLGFVGWTFAIIVYRSRQRQTERPSAPARETSSRERGPSLNRPGAMSSNDSLDMRDMDLGTGRTNHTTVHEPRSYSTTPASNVTDHRLIVNGSDTKEDSEPQWGHFNARLERQSLGASSVQSRDVPTDSRLSRFSSTLSSDDGPSSNRFLERSLSNSSTTSSTASFLATKVALGRQSSLGEDHSEVFEAQIRVAKILSDEGNHVAAKV